MSLVVHKLVLSPGGATATTAQPPTAHHVTLSAYTHARSNATDSMGRVLDGPPSGSMSTPPASSSPYSSSSSNSSSSKHSSTYNLPFVLQDHNYGAPPPPTPPHSPPPLPSTSSSSSTSTSTSTSSSSSSSSHVPSNTSSSSASTYQHHHFQQHHQQQQQHQYHHHHHHRQTYQSAAMAPSSSTTPSPSSSASSFTSHHHIPSTSASSHHHQHHHHHHPVTTSTTSITAPHHHHHHHSTTTTTANPYHHHHQQQQHHHHSSTTTTTTSHLQQKHHNLLQHPGPSPRLGSSSSASTTLASTSSSSSTSNTPLSSATFSSPSLSVGGVMAHHPLTNMPPHRQQFMPHPKSNIVFPSPHIPPPPVELSPHHPHHQSLPPSAGPPQPLLPSTETDDDSRLSDRSSSVGPSGEETETAPEGEGDDLPADDSITRCVCDFSHDDGYMIQCDRCFVWQHVDCMEIDRDNIPDEYLCEACDPRPIDRLKARALQIRRRQEIKAHLARLSSSDSEDNIPMSTKSRGSLNKVQERKVVKKKKVKQIKDMKNGRKGGSGSNGSLSLLKKSGSGSNTTTTLCNNSLLSSQEDKDRRMLVKRRRKSNSLSGGEGVSDDSSGGPVERLRAWVEGYEAAVTNHYSPELRARVHAARINGVSPDLRASTQGAVLGHRCRVVNNPQPLFDVFDSKILVAATRLSPNTAITEFQGKYLLASQWNAQQPVSSQPYMPYVLQYHMPKEGLNVCVDARTYGNDARFARHSCMPNAEVRHVVERGSLHLYIVATQEVEEGEEVTLSLETANSTLELVCCLAEEHDCRAPPGPRPEQTTSAPALTHKKNGLIVGNKKTLKKQQLQLQLRTSKRTTSSDTRLMESATSIPVNPSTPVTTVKQRRASGCGKSPVKSPSTASQSSSPDEVSKDITANNNSSSSTLSSATGTVAAAPDTPTTTLEKQQQQKMTREERKIAAYMKAFERMEKAAQRRQEMEKKKEEDKGKEVREHKEKEKKRCDGDEEDWEKTSSADECVRSMVGADRCRRKGKKGRGKGSPQKRSNHRTDSAASDLTGDESSCASVGLMSPSGGATMESIALNFNSPPQGNPNAMGFRFPKTKKALMNEWLNENVDPVVPAGSVVGTDLPSGVPPCYMRSPAMPLRRSSLNQTTGTGVMPVQDMPGGSAKKRWLRQAISEETETPQFNGLCPSPNSRPDSPTGGGDYITPLKKRRLARESMSSELSSTPPSTPVHSTSLEEDKMVEEMEAELAEEDSHKIKSSCRYSQATSPSTQDDSRCIGFLRSSTDNNNSSGRMKRVVVQEDEEEEEDLVIDEGGSFFDQGSGAVNFSKVAACGRISQEQAEEQCKGEEDKGRGVPLGKNRKGRVCYNLQEDKEEEEEEEEEEEGEEKEIDKKKSNASEEQENHEEKQKQKVDNNRRIPMKTKRRQNAVKKGIRCQQKQQTAKRGKKQQGGSAKKGKQEKAKTDTKKRKTWKRGKEEAPPEKEEEGKEKEMEKKEEKPIVKEEEKPKVAEDMLQIVKEEQCQPEMKTEIAEVTTEADCKIEPEIEREQEPVKVEETVVKKEDKVGAEEESKKVPEIKSEPEVPVAERIDTTKPQDIENTSENKRELCDNLKEIKHLDNTENANTVNKTTNSDHDRSSQNIEVKKEKEEDVFQKSDADTEVVAETKQNSDDNQEQLCPTTATSEASQASSTENKEPLSRTVKEIEEHVSSADQKPSKKIAKNVEKGKRKMKKPQRQMKKAEEPKQQHKEVNESLEISCEKEDTNIGQCSTQNESETEEMTYARQEEPVLERRDIEGQSASSEGSKSPQAHANKEVDDEISTQEQVHEKAAQCDTKETPQTPAEEAVDKTTLHPNSDGTPVITLESRWKLDTPHKAEEHTIEVSRKPPTPPTLFPPLPWQTNPDTFLERDSTRPKTPENSSYLGVRGPRTPEGPAPTSPSDQTMSPPNCFPRSPHTSVGDSESIAEESRVRETTAEGSWRPRARGPCTPPTPPPQEDSFQEEEQQLQQEGGEESNSSPSHQHPPCNPESTQTRPAPVKKKLSILEYRKRKSVGGESGPLDSSLPPCQLSSCSSVGDASSNTHESLAHGGPHSPGQSSPPGLTGGSGEDGDSSPDLPLSPIVPIILPPSPINFDTRSTAEETKREGENYRSNASGSGSSSDLSRHNIMNKIMISNNNSINTSNGSSNNNSGSCAATESSTTPTTTTTSTTAITGTHTPHPISGGNAQDVKWNAAPTLLERQRENLTARLRREFGLCVADDDDDKSSVRLGCSGVLSKPSPPLLPPATLSNTMSPLSPRVRKPPSLTVGPVCMPYAAEVDERGHRRNKNLPLPLPPPPPPPPTPSPKNSIFQGREVTVQKVAGTVVKATVTGTVQSAGGTAGGVVVSVPQRLQGSSGLFPVPTPNPPPVPTPSPPTPLAPPGVRGGSSSQGTAAASPGIPNVLPGAVPRPCPIPPPIGVPPVPAPPVVQTGLAVLPALAHSLTGLPPSKQPGPCITPTLTAPQQNPEYPGRPFPRGQFSAPSITSLTSPMSLYSAARLGPPPPPPLPPQTNPAGPGLRGPIPPGHTDPARVGGEGGTSYSGQDCSAPGTRGS